MRKTTFLLCCVVTIIACSKDNNKPSLSGNWEWVRTDGGFNFHIHETPASTGKNILLTFGSSNRYTISTNGQITSSGTYELHNVQSIHNHEQVSLIDFSAATDSDMTIHQLTRDSLSLSDNTEDGVGSLYIRK